MKSAELPIVVPSEELFKLIDEAKISLGYKLHAGEMIEIPEILGTSDLGFAPLWDIRPSSRKAYLKERRVQFQLKLKAELEFRIKELGNNIAAAFIDALFTALNQIVVQFICPIDKIYLESAILYNSLVRLFRTLCDPNLKEELKKELKARLILSLK